MTGVIFYHNPRCSKSRLALQLLRDRGIGPSVVEYLKRPFSEDQIKRLLDMLDMSPRELMRKKEEEYAALGLDNPELSPSLLIKALAEHPILMERPIAVAGERAVLGRPPERILDIL
jgi:arsenate reductase